MASEPLTAINVDSKSKHLSSKAKTNMSNEKRGQ